MKLTQRLLAIGRFVPQGSTVIDIGTDHALLPIYLMRNKIARCVIATDISPGPLESAHKNITSAGLEDFIALRLGNGLDVLKAGEADTCIIAGMGGGTIRDIIQNAGNKARSLNRFILQPMGAAGSLRIWLAHKGWQIKDEELISEDSRIYEIIMAIPGEEKAFDSTVISVGPRLFEKRHPLLIKIIMEEIRQNNEIMECLKHTESMGAVTKREALTERNMALERILKCL